MQNNAMDDRQRALAFLNQDVLKNIVLLKMLQAYSSVIDCYYAEAASGAGVLLLLHTAAFAFDRQTYPTTKTVVLLSTRGPAVAQTLLPFVPTTHNLVFKLNDPQDAQLIDQIFRPQRVTAYLSYTAPTGKQWSPAPDVLVAEQLDEQCLALYVAQGHAHADVVHWFATQQALSFTRYEQGAPVATCFAYRNFGAVWEIGGVFTVASARRKGYAQAVVQTALHQLGEQGCVPRYQVHEENLPSIRLAAALGLYRFLTVEHFLYEAVTS